ncbi:MAG: hypothetical protein MUP17_11620 [candidate division Zixibacteria bacterium]|nr:hypothetical protein [candidate division Zixibacteria bacterium]
MKLLLEKLGVSIHHLICLDRVFSENHDEYQRIETILNSDEFRPVYSEISRELYAGGKQPSGNIKLARQMILGDVIEYIFTGRAYYYAAKSDENFKNFLKLILYSVNQLLIYDSITVDSHIRKLYIEKLEEEIDGNLLYEKPGDAVIANDLKESKTVLNDDNWKRFDFFIDSILPKTLGCPKELIVFAELLRTKKGIIIPLLLIQRLFGDKNPIAPPDFLLAKSNKEIYGIEVGYAKEGQSREFSIRTSVPTFAVDLENNMHNRCPKCGEIILYCDYVINAYSNGTLNEQLDENSGRYLCNGCPSFDNGNCKFSNYYGSWKGIEFNGKESEQKSLHYHSRCVKDGTYDYRRSETNISDHSNEFFAQLPLIQGLENL